MQNSKTLQKVLTSLDVIDNIIDREDPWGKNPVLQEIIKHLHPAYNDLQDIREELLTLFTETIQKGKEKI